MSSSPPHALWLAPERHDSGEYAPASGVLASSVGRPSLITRLASAGERFLTARTRWEVFAALEDVLLGLSGIEEFAILQLTRSGWMPIWWSGTSNADLSGALDRRGRQVLREAVATYSLEVSPHLVATLAVLRVQDDGGTRTLDDEVVGFACYETGKKLKGYALDDERPTTRPLKRL
jgi:hypothetical protein